MTPPVKMGYRKVRRLSCNPKFKIILPLIMARAQRRPFQIVSTSEKSGTPQAMTEGVLPSKKEPLHVISCNGSFGMLLQIHHAADLGGGDGDGAQSGLVGIAAHRKDGAAPGGKVRVPCQRKGLPVLRHGAEAV